MAEKKTLRDARGARSSGTTAGAFDIRNVIGALLGIYGLILLGMAAFGSTEEDKTGGINANLWIGIILVVAAAIFLSWAQLRPVEVKERSEDDDPR
jgi:membrane protein DedA with SNARE-associated domain